MRRHASSKCTGGRQYQEGHHRRGTFRRDTQGHLGPAPLLKVRSPSVLHPVRAARGGTKGTKGTWFLNTFPYNMGGCGIPI